MPPPPPLLVPELLRQASQFLAELADRAEQLSDAGGFCCDDLKVERGVAIARQALEIRGPV
jgi:hypothetical protein